MLLPLQYMCDTNKILYLPKDSLYDCQRFSTFCPVISWKSSFLYGWRKQRLIFCTVPAPNFPSSQSKKNAVFWYPSSHLLPPRFQCGGPS